MWVVAEANMLYLETPAGVGFSYSTNSSFYDGVDDKITGMRFLSLASLSDYVSSLLSLRYMQRAAVPSKELSLFIFDLP